MRSLNLLGLCLVLFAATAPGCAGVAAADWDYEHAVANAPRYRGDLPARANPDGNLLLEAEEFKSGGKPDLGWASKNWGENYYAATFALTFLSRKGFLGAPPQCDSDAATLEIEVPEAGSYLVLARYEAAFRFETQFRVRIEQGGRTVFDRLYGARDNTKIWGFRKGLQKEVMWYWGAVENPVWEGHDAAADLQAGPARVTLVADKQPEPAAKRNVDALLLTRDKAMVEDQLKRAGYLPLDGMLTQAGDVYFRVVNKGDKEVSLGIGPGREHSPYWIHARYWKPVGITAAPGQTSEWTEVGSVLCSMNDGQWAITASGGPYLLEAGLKSAAGAIEPIAQFELSGGVELAYDANTRYTRRLRTSEGVLYDLLDYLRKTPVRGQPLKRTIVYGYTFEPRPGNEKYNAALRQFIDMYTLQVRQQGAATFLGKPAGYIDLRNMDLGTLAANLKKLQADGVAADIRTVSLGDEIGLPAPAGDAHEAFRAWARGRGLKPAQLAADAGEDWSKVLYAPDPKTREQNPRGYYYSQLFAHDFGIAAMKASTDLIKAHLPNADAGANFSPHHGPAYLGEAHKWITLFRKSGMTMPWSEDYIWQIPVGSQQMNFILLDLARAANRYHPGRDIHFYVMPHWPGNTPNSWRRLFFGCLGHGMTIVNLFEFRPVQAAYTENHSTLPEMYATVRQSLFELAEFEDIVQDGQVRWGQAALWYSQAGDVWDNHRDPFGAGKRSLYIAARHLQMPLDIVDEEDALKGTLASYKTLYLADLNVSQAAGAALAQWVAAGGTLLATAGAGMYDEYNQPNQTLQQLLGVQQTDLAVDSQVPIHFEKQDLPFAPVLDTVTWKDAQGQRMIPAFGAVSRVRTQGGEVLATFKDGSPAVTRRQVEKGAAVYVGFLPGLSYFHPAIPKRPVDRGSTDDAMAHFIPTQFDPNALALVALGDGGVARPVLASNPLAQTSLIDSPHGVAIPVVNWSPAPLQGLTLTLTGKFPTAKVALASGGKIDVKTQGDTTTLTFDLHIADAVILR